MKPAALAFALLAALPACVAQQPAKEPPKEPFRLAAGEVQIPALIDQCAAYLQVNILSSPNELTTGQPMSVKLQQPVTTDRDGCEELLASLLYRSGLGLMWLDDKGSMLEVVNMMGPRGRELWSRTQERSVEAVMARPNLKMPVTVAVPLDHINATFATNALRPFFASSGAVPGSLTLGNVGNNKSLLLSGMQDQVVQAIRLVKKCDLPGSYEGTGMPMPDMDRVGKLEARVKALEEQLGKAKAADAKPGETKAPAGDAKAK